MNRTDPNVWMKRVELEMEVRSGGIDKRGGKSARSEISQKVVGLESRYDF